MISQNKSQRCWRSILRCLNFFLERRIGIRFARTAAIVKPTPECSFLNQGTIFF